MLTSEILARLGAKQNNGAWWAKCPAHKDNNPSLKIDEGKGGQTLAKCFAGCSFEDVCAASGIPPEEWFGDTPQKSTKTDSRIAATYDYRDAAGKKIFQVVRFIPKDFRQRQPDGNGGWIWRVPKDLRTIYNLPEVLAQVHKGRVVFVTEGEKDADAVTSLGMVATCNPGGAGKWQDNYTEAFSGAHAVILPDNDEPGLAHGEMVAARIGPVCKSLRMTTLPEAKDAADWVKAGGTVEQLREIVSATPLYVPKPMELLSDRRKVTSKENGKKGGRPAAPPSSEVAAEIAKTRYTVGGHLILRHWRDRWFIFDHGWTEQSDGEIEKTVVTYLQSDEELARFSSRNYARNIMANMASFKLCGVKARVNMPCWLSSGQDARNWVAFSNGKAVDIWGYAEDLAAGKTPGKDRIRDVSPDLFSADFVDYPWNPEQVPTKWLAYMDRVQPGLDGFAAVRRMMGLLLADTGKYEVFFQLYGQGNNGKTVCLDVLDRMLGRNAVCRVPLEALAPGTRFQSFPLAECKANVCGELSTDTGRGQLHAIEGNFKHCVSGGVIEIERKGVDKSSSRCRARFVLSANSLPTFVDKSNAMWRRLRIIPFSVAVPEAEQDADLAEKICADELPGVCAWALDGLSEIIATGRVIDCEAGSCAKMTHRETCDHERTFLLENYEPGTADDKVTGREIYDAYKDWMAENGYRSLGAAKFSARVEAILPTAKHKVIRIQDHTAKGFTGIRGRISL